MPRITELLLCAALLASGCSSATRACSGEVVTSVLRFSGGTVSTRIAEAEVYGTGCVRYASQDIRKCVCDGSGALKAALEDRAVEEVVTTLRIVPNTMADSEGLTLRHRGVAATRANPDLSRSVRDWLSALDTALGPLIGPGYQPFLEQ